MNNYKIVSTTNQNTKSSKNSMFDLGQSIAQSIDNEDSIKIIKQPSKEMTHNAYLTLILATAFIDYSIPFLLTHKLESYYKANTVENENVW